MIWDKLWLVENKKEHPKWDRGFYSPNLILIIWDYVYGLIIFLVNFLGNLFIKGSSKMKGTHMMWWREFYVGIFQ